ncbi:LLM class flavin-dependent oxidoreductase [Ktedonobacter robiniae]|uniref:Luciferase n=1 Tax=Ktedonobacter robiniae TaxID=2778365 RepID=A0ABQ3V716_9CHLR|nr:LLM class flavin-dependent oxidoreductase [Ktedonobacter robiniae]GHO60357.1 luciferase [Ktedonobacter robiniae]
MKIGLSIPPTITSPDHFEEWVRRVDAGPFSTLGVLDRIVYSNFEPLVTLATAAALTTRVRLMTEVLISLVRNTTILAKESATLDLLSRGRLTLGIGLGGREDDYLATGMPYEHRGKRLEEQLEQMKRIWAGQPVCANVGPIGPQPAQAHGPKLLLGGYTAGTIQRVARFADGIIAGTNETKQIEQTFRAVEQRWQEAGRAGRPHLVAQIDIALEKNGVEEGRKYLLDYYATLPSFVAAKSATLLTTTQQLLDTMHLLEQIGTDELVFFTWSAAIEQIDRIADLLG